MPRKRDRPRRSADGRWQVPSADPSAKRRGWLRRRPPAPSPEPPPEAPSPPAGTAPEDAAAPPPPEKDAPAPTTVPPSKGATAPAAGRSAEGAPLPGAGSPPEGAGSPAGGDVADGSGLPAFSAEEEAARRVRNARRAEAQRRAREQKRARRSQAVARRRRRRAAAERRRGVRRRTGLLTLVLTLGVLIAGVAVSGGLVAASLTERPERLAAPLRVYPVEQVVPGACPAGTQGLTGHTATGTNCYRLTRGIAIYEVADIEVRQGGGSRPAPEVTIDLLSVDRRAFADLTRRSVGRDVAFVVRDRLVTAPRVEAPITGGKVIIAGTFTRADAQRLVRELKGGS